MVQLNLQMHFVSLPYTHKLKSKHAAAILKTIISKYTKLNGDKWLDACARRKADASKAPD